MAVLVEAISVVVRVDAIHERYPGGWDKFRDAVPNQTLCSDNEVARVGFMSPGEVERFVTDLERVGLLYKDLRTGKALEVAVVDQQRGLMTPCDWLECGVIALDGVEERPVSACRIPGSECRQLMMPDGWAYEGSLSQRFPFVPSDQVDRRLAYLGMADGIGRYVDRGRGNDLFGSPPPANNEGD